MAFIGKALTEIPARTGVGRPWDREAANALKGLTDTAGQTATDGEVFPDSKSARAAANSAKRLLAHVVPESIEIETRVYPVDGGFGWSVWQNLPGTSTEKKPKK